MQKTIEDLYYGNISPSEQFHPTIRGYKRKKQALLKCENAFMSDLSQAQIEKFQDIVLRQAELSSIELTQTFVDGFRLGMRLAQEAFCCDGEPGSESGQEIHTQQDSSASS